MQPKAVEFVKAFFAAGKPVAADLPRPPGTVIEAGAAGGPGGCAGVAGVRLKTDIRQQAGGEGGWTKRSWSSGNLGGPARKPGADKHAAFEPEMIALFARGAQSDAGGARRGWGGPMTRLIRARLRYHQPRGLGRVQQGSEPVWAGARGRSRSDTGDGHRRDVRRRGRALAAAGARRHVGAVVRPVQDGGAGARRGRGGDGGPRARGKVNVDENPGTAARFGSEHSHAARDQGGQEVDRIVGGPAQDRDRAPARAAPAATAYGAAPAVRPHQARGPVIGQGTWNLERGDRPPRSPRCAGVSISA